MSPRAAIVSPSGISTPSRLLAGMNWLSQQGITPVPLSATQRILEGTGGFRYLGGDDATRIQELEEAFSGEYDLVWMARGGSGMARLVPGLRFERFARVPFFGFSDGTTLLNMLASMGFMAVHAPVVQMLGDVASENTRGALSDFLRGAPRALTGEVWQEGEVVGELVGGNLCVLASLVGTAAQVQTHGKIVLLEDIQEPPYKIDRLLTQLVQSGFFEGCRGVVVGEFLDCKAPATASWTTEDVLKDFLLPLQIPVLARVPVGHGTESWPVPLGRVHLRGGTLWLEPVSAIVQAPLEQSA